MTKFNPVTLIRRLDGIRADTLASRHTCGTAFARELHGRLLEEIEAMVADLQREVETWKELHAHRRDSEADAFLFKIYYDRTVFEHRWMHGGKISILDDIYLVHRDGEGEACVVALDYAEVPTAQLEGLPDLFDKIEREIGVHIVAARVNRG